MSIREVLRLNAVFSGASGLVLVLGHEFLARAFGLPRAALVAVGVVLLVYAADLTISAVRRGLRRIEVLLYATADAAWVAGTVALLVAAPHLMSATGRIALAAFALPVAWFAAQQFRAARSFGDRALTAGGTR